MSSLKPALQDDDLRKALKQFQWDNDGSGPYYEGAGGNDEDPEENWVEVKEEQEDEWEWDQWEPEPASEPSVVGPLPPPPPPPTPPPEELNPKSQSWDYNTEADHGQGSWKWGGKWNRGHGSWNQDSRWRGHDKSWNEPWRSPQHSHKSHKAPWANRKRTPEGRYVKGGFEDQEGNFWQYLVVQLLIVFSWWYWTLFFVHMGIEFYCNIHGVSVIDNSIHNIPKRDSQYDIIICLIYVYIHMSYMFIDGVC